MQSDTRPNTAHRAGVESERTTNPAKQPTTAHPTSTPVHNSANRVTSHHEADDDLPVVERRLGGTVVLLELGSEPALGSDPERCRRDGRLACLMHAVQGLWDVREVEPREWPVRGDAALPE